jgi:hypothetical protein
MFGCISVVEQSSEMPAMAGYRYHVFLSHSSTDKPAVEELARWLVREGLTPFLIGSQLS